MADYRDIELTTKFLSFTIHPNHVIPLRGKTRRVNKVGFKIGDDADVREVGQFLASYKMVLIDRESGKYILSVPLKWFKLVGEYWEYELGVILDSTPIVKLEKLEGMPELIPEKGFTLTCVLDQTVGVEI